MTPSLSLRSSAAAVPVDIPDSWDPRTKQQPTGLIACRLRAAVLFDPSSPQDKKMTSSLSLRSSAAAVPVDIPDSWDPRTKQQPTGLIACRLRAAVLFDPSSPQDKKMTSSLSLRSSAAAVPVDIPDSWDPRTKQQPTGLIACRLRAAVLFDPSSPQDKK